SYALGLGVVTWSPLGGGHADRQVPTGRERPCRRLWRQGFPAGNSAQRTLILDTVLDIAAERGVSASQVAIAWASTHGAIPIIGPRSQEQIADNLGAWH
ncbi:aldo/keto reductase, partial [Pseudomonas syringae pv. actinidiae]|nr:aldo/keto reductase [Pseudomonas syringae pv. actinidiae]